MKKTLFAMSAMALALTACNPQPQPAQPNQTASGAAAPVAGLETESKQVSYLLGYQFGQGLPLLEFKEAKIELDQKAFFDAINDVLANKEPKLNAEQAQSIMQNVGQKVDSVMQKAASEALGAGEKFLSENKTKQGVTETPSGLQIKTNKQGSGEMIRLGDMATVEYEGRLINGNVFDRSKNHSSEPVEFAIMEQAAIPGWIEGFQHMQEGGEYTLYIPASLAYGAEPPTPKIPPNSVLVFDVKVFKVLKGEAEKRLQAAKAEQEKMMKEQEKQKK